MITNICNIKYRAKLSLSIFLVEIKAALNNKHIFDLEYMQLCKKKKNIEPPKHKRSIVQCANCHRYGHTNNYCHLKPRCVKCAGDQLTNQCHRNERWHDVPCIICGGNHPANYKGCTVDKDLQKKTHPPLYLKIYAPPAPIKQTLYTHPGSNIRSITKQNSYAPTNIEQVPHINQSHQQTTDKQELKNIMKSLLEQMGTFLNLLTTVLTKLK
jgi:hypothetical protein